MLFAACRFGRNPAEGGRQAMRCHLRLHLAGLFVGPRVVLLSSVQPNRGQTPRRDDLWDEIYRRLFADGFISAGALSPPPQMPTIARWPLQRSFGWLALHHGCTWRADLDPSGGGP